MKKIVSYLIFVGFVSTLMLSCSSKQVLSGDKKLLAQKEVEDLVFVLDISSSMLSQDFEPNRLAAVKLILEKIISQKEINQHVAIVVFANEAAILCPLSKDVNLLSTKVKTIQVGKIEDGTAIGKGIMFALYALSKSKNKKKGIIVLTDGVNNAEAYPVKLAAQLAKQQNVQVSSIGIGCRGMALSPIAKKKNGDFIFSRTVVSIDEELLSLIGSQTAGNYYRVSCNADLEDFQNIDKLFMESNTIAEAQTIGKEAQQKIDSLWQRIPIENKAVLDKLAADSD